MHIQHGDVHVCVRRVIIEAEVTEIKRNVAHLCGYETNAAWVIEAGAKKNKKLLDRRRSFIM